MGSMLERPMSEKKGETYTSSGGISMGGSSLQGWRMEMEDAHVMSELSPDHFIVGVFDGHAGANAAKFAGTKMAGAIRSSPAWDKYVASAIDAAHGSLKLLGNLLQDAFVSLDSLLEEHLMMQESRSGCTAVVAIVTPKYIICANAGDARCVIGINGVAKALSTDHKPDHEFEKKRIEKAGGSLIGKRVEGELAVSRALGDFSFKNRPDLPPKDQKVSCYPVRVFAAMLFHAIMMHEKEKTRCTYCTHYTHYTHYTQNTH